MTRLSRLIVVLSVLIAVPAWAGRGGRHEWARVVSVTPIYESFRVVTPHRRCWTERVGHKRRRHSRHHSAAPGLIGATAGGAMGWHSGHDRTSRHLGMITGVLLGGTIGHAIGHEHRPHRRHGRHFARRRHKERCELHEEVRYEQRVTGYDVEYRYRGRTYRARRDDDPGRRIRVAVGVTPVD